MSKKTFKHSPQGKGVRTGLQAIAGAVAAYFTGLVALPEVREYTTNFVQTQGLAAVLVFLGSLGVGAGVLAFIQNRLGK